MNRSLLVLPSALLLAACGPGGDDGGPEPMHASGRVSDAQGAPLAGVEVSVSGVTAAGERTSLQTTTDAEGRYSVRVPDGIYRVAARHTRDWNGRPARFALHPADGTDDQQDAAKGISEDFVWRLTGLKPGEQAGDPDASNEPAKYYGGHVRVTSQEHGFSGTYRYFAAGSTLELTLAPEGARVDGSQGEPLTFRRTFDQDVSSSISWNVADVPVGVYTLSARVVGPDGTARPIEVRGFSGEYAPSVRVDFEPTQFGDMQMQQVTVATEAAPL